MEVKVNKIVVSDAPTQARTISSSNVKRLRNPVFDYKMLASRTTFESPEYDLAQIDTVEDTDSYVRQAHRKKKGLAFKEGWSLQGKNLDTLSYIKKRFAQLEIAQDRPWNMLVKQVFQDLNAKSNAFLVKVRNIEYSGGNVRKDGNTRVRPVAAYFPMQPETVEAKKDDLGRITKYRQTMPDGRYKDYSPRDVVHFKLDQKTGSSFGTPILTPVIEDIRALRRIEENIDLLVYQNLFPLFQYTVGTMDRPAMVYPDGTTEVDLVRNELEYMPPEGVLVTPERHEISMVGAEGRALKAEGYLTHFKERVFAGIGVSSVDMGEGGTSNRNTADRLSDNIRDDVKSIQSDFADQFNFYVIRELLLEGKFNFDPLLEENTVLFFFKEIDLDRKIAWENHVVQLFTQHAINEDELRIRLGEEPKSIDDEEYRSKTYWKLVTEPQSLITAVDEAYLATAAANNPQTAIQAGDIKEGSAGKKSEAAAKSSTSTKSAADKKNGGQKSGAARDNPSNQHGSRGGPKLRKDFFDNTVSEAFDTLLGDVVAYTKAEASEDYIKRVVDAWKTRTVSLFNKEVRVAFYDGVSATGLDPLDEQTWNDIYGPLRTTEKHAEKYVRKLGADMQRRFTRLVDMEDGLSKKEVMSILDISSNRVDGIYDSELRRAYNYGRFSGLKLRGNETAKILEGDSACEHCKNRTSELIIKDTTIDDIPPWHPFCDCLVSTR